MKNFDWFQRQVIAQKLILSWFGLDFVHLFYQKRFKKYNLWYKLLIELF